MTFPSQVPDAGTPIFDAGGYINPVWHQFFFTLLNRTGGEEGAAPVTQVTGAAPITSTGGTQPEIGIDPATPTLPGSMSAADKAKLDTVTAGAAVSAVTGSAPISSSGGTAPDISIAAATTLAAGSMSASDKAKLDGITPGAGVVSVGATAPITSSGGANPNIAINAATPSLPGSMSAADKTRIDALSATSSPTFQALTLTNGQVVFPAVQVPSANPNTLDDYEEGTWTPVLTFATPGNLSVAYSLQSAAYTKIGRQVFVNFVILTSSFTHTTASGDLLVTGFPFSNAAVTTLAFKVDWGGITKAGYTEISGTLPNGSTQANFTGSGSGVARQTVTTANVPSGGTVFLSGTASYFV